MKVLLLGYYGYGNFGDELMRLALEDFFQKFQIQYITALPKRRSNDTISRFNLFQVMGALYECDMLIYGGGGLLQDVTSLRSFLYYASVIELAGMMRKPVILFGNSLGPTKRWISRFILRRLIRKPDVYLFARDVVSFRYAKQLNGNTVLSADPSVRILRKLELVPEKKYDLVIVPRNSERIRDYTIFGRKFGKVLVCPSQDTDIPVAKAIAANIGADLFEETHDAIESLKKIISGELIISERFHPTVVASYYGVPFVSLENSKAQRFFRKYTKRRDFFAKEVWEVEERIERIKREPLYLRDEMDKEVEDSFKQLYRLMLRLKK
ncbi:polysaccharide pyruvyl transferase family protein [Fervidobacterium thailandense]|uniref:Polysaccharide pyruvyl transferase n=1 Tax=Fervidobacterium thailandense TaxID=1008305 RepID=A0A1E3G4I9_9BACT|nr:polysaccharide pyruvyl transferase family protein [Fervidobacterium thailandense]ODN31149.1 polysaccharide pyruvyl transferase [Fervidobacterium thailandense]